MAKQQLCSRAAEQTLFVQIGNLAALDLGQQGYHAALHECSFFLLLMIRK